MQNQSSQRCKCHDNSAVRKITNPDLGGDLVFLEMASAIDWR